MSHETVPPALQLDDLNVAYQVRGVWRPILRGVSLEIARGESYGLVGESGCGKSTAAFAAVRYLAENGRITGGSVSVAGADLLTMRADELRSLRATRVSMVYQNPSAALNPTARIGKQVVEAFELAGVPTADARERAHDMLAEVRIADPDRVMRSYPHQLSGGMLQRVVIAMALAKDTALLILDEPTTGLDAMVEAEVLDLVGALRRKFSTAVLLISHNLAVIGRVCDRVGVLYAGRLVEQGPVLDVLNAPRHPYTVGLLRCLPDDGARKTAGRLDTIPGMLPKLGANLQGCVFADRCGLAQDVCRTDEPAFLEVGAERNSRCHFWDDAQSLPRTTAPPAPRRQRPDASPFVIRAEGVSKTYRHDGRDVRVLDGVSIELRPGETLGLVGESGSGKTTLARAILGLAEADPGAVIELDGEPLEGRLKDRTVTQVRALQIVFQNPDGALNRRFSVRRILGRALRKLSGVRGDDCEQSMLALTDSVRFDSGLTSERFAKLSGGLKQRVAIARAFAGHPRVVVCDEPTSALDASIQAAILNLLVDLQAEQDVSYLFISHDLAVVRYVSDRIAVLYMGKLMEAGDVETVFAAPHHPYTEALVAAALDSAGATRLKPRNAERPEAVALPSRGCVFAARCPRYIGAICDEEEPELLESEPGHLMRCHHSLADLRALQTSAPGATTPAADGVH